jgi:hypothetical protein
MGPELAHLVRTCWAVDRVEGLLQVVGDGIGSGEGVVAGLDLDGSVAAYTICTAVAPDDVFTVRMYGTGPL